MGFLTPAAAWFALSLPVIAAMYILKRTYLDTEIASHLLWRRVLQEQEANRPWQRLRSRWLLFLQLLAALLLVLALMGPYAERAAVNSGHAVLMIDRSGSMTAVSAQGGKQTRLEQALLTAEQWVDEQPSHLPITLLTAGAIPEVLASKQSNHAEIKTLLKTITPYYGKTDQTAALSLADSLMQGNEGGAITIVTDGQWADAEEAERLLVTSPIELIMVDAEASARNAAIVYFGIESDISGEGLSRGAVTVRNDSTREQSVTVHILAENEDGNSVEQVKELTLTIAAGGWESAELSDLPEARYYKAFISSLTDAILADNTAYAFPSITRTHEALMITEGNLFLEKALLLAGVKPVKINPESAPPAAEQAESIDWIIVDGAYDKLLASDGWSSLLEQHPLWIIDHPAKDTTDSIVPSNMRVETKEHEVTSYITFSDTYIGRFAKLSAEEASWGEPVLTYGGIPAIYAGSVGGYNRLRFTFDLQSSDLPLRSEFPVLVVQAAEWMSGGTQLELGAAEAGQVTELALQSDTAEAEWLPVEVAAAGLASELAKEGRAFPALATDSGQYTIPEVPGLYKLIERSTEGIVISDRLLAVTANIVELSELSGSDKGLTLSAGQDGGSESNGAGTGELQHQQPMLLWVVLLLLLLMLAEWEVYRRGYTS